MIGAVTSTDATKTASDTTKTATTGNDSMGKDMFLKLLVAQLKYQDPMKPTDGTAFIAQTSQLSMVEKLEDILSATTANAVSNASLAATGLVGRTVQYEDADGKSVTGSVSAVRLDRTGPILVVGKAEVALANVLQVLATAPAAATASDSAAATTAAAAAVTDPSAKATDPVTAPATTTATSDTNAASSS